MGPESGQGGLLSKAGGTGRADSAGRHGMKVTVPLSALGSGWRVVKVDCANHGPLRKQMAHSHGVTEKLLMKVVFTSLS